MNQHELAISAARRDFIENKGHLSLVGASSLEALGLSPAYFERVFTSENHELYPEDYIYE